jgi:hypothetical protein
MRVIAAMVVCLALIPTGCIEPVDAGSGHSSHEPAATHGHVEEDAVPSPDGATEAREVHADGCAAASPPEPATTPAADETAIVPASVDWRDAPRLPVRRADGTTAPTAVGRQALSLLCTLRT